MVLTRDRTYRKEKNKLIPAMKVRYGKKFPKLIKALENRHIGYNQTLDYLYRQEKEGKIFILQPQNRLKSDDLKEIRISCTNYMKMDMKLHRIIMKH